MSMNAPGLDEWLEQGGELGPTLAPRDWFKEEDMDEPLSEPGEWGQCWMKTQKIFRNSNGTMHIDYTDLPSVTHFSGWDTHEI